MSFFKYHIDTIFNLDINEYEHFINNSKFRKYIIDNIDDKFLCVQLCSKTLLKYVIKPQRCLYECENYYIAVDLVTNIYYMCMKNILMIDVDFNKTNFKTMDDILNNLKIYSQNTGDSYIIYKSRNGAHIFVTNRTFDYKSREAIEYMYNFGCDFNYICFAYIRGWSVRLNRKDENDMLYKYIDEINPENHKEDIINIINKHILMVNRFQNIIAY